MAVPEPQPPERGPSPGRVTEVLAAAGAGDPAAREELLALVYGELRALARSQMRRERAGHTLQATVLVHDAFLQLVGQRDARWQSRAQFFRVAAVAMRRLLSLIHI